MTKEEVAAALNGSEYGEEGSKELFAQMKAGGLVAVFGASDDLMEFRGAIYDEVGCYGGGDCFITRSGLLEACDGNCIHSERALEKATTITAVWDRDGYSWIYETAISHATFDVMEDGDTYCRGIVFALSEVPA